MADEQQEMTVAQLKELLTLVTAAQSMLLGAIVRPLLQSGALGEDALRDSLQHLARAAYQRRAQETPTLTALIEILLQDLGLNKGTSQAPS